MKVKNQKEIEIINVAYRIFRDKGYHNAKMKSIADKAGIGKGTLYEYFASKKDLFEKSMIFSMETGFNEIKKVLDNDLNFKDKTVEYLNYKLKFLEKQQTLFESFFTNRDLISDKVRDTFFNFMKEHYLGIVSLVEEGIEEGQVREDADKEILASCILGISHQYLGINSLGKRSSDIDFEKIIDSILEGFGRRPK